MNFYLREVRGLMRAAILAVAAVLLPGLASAETLEGGTIRIVVPYAPGAATDNLARLLAQGLEEKLKVTVVIDNRAGGGTQIGTRAVATAKPDGRTLGFIDTAFAINPGLVGAALPYDTIKDFTPISLMATAQLVLVVNPAVKAQNISELVALAKAEPGKVGYATTGVGSAPHLAGQQFKEATGANIVHVPFNSGGFLTNVVGGHVAMAFPVVASARDFVESGSLRALAVTGPERARLLPNVPTMKEAGFPAIDATPFFGLIGPKGLPPEVLAQLSETASAALREGAIKEKVVQTGFNPVGGNSAEFKPWLEKEITKWAGVIERSGERPK